MQGTPRAAALLVGVDDYGTYDASTGRPPGASNLQGARNDVKAWYVAARALGIPADAIEVRTSPVLTAADMPIDATGTRFGPATRAGILEGVAQLGERLGGSVAQGLLTWSGHGATDEDGELLLCPSDVTGSLGGAIAFPTLADLLDTVVPAHGLTVVLDTCHAGATGMVGGAFGQLGGRSLGSRAEGVSAKAPALRPHDRVLSACGPHQSAREYVFQTAWHGAFTWALTTLLQRWGVEHDAAGVGYVGVSYEELLTRATELLAAASFLQLPTLTGAVADANVPFAWPTGAGDAPDVTRPHPAPIEEIDPGTEMGVYAIAGTGGVTLGYLVCVAGQNVTVGGHTWLANREYWCWSGTAFPASFTLKTYGSTPPNDISPSSAIVYESKPFPPGVSSLTAPTTGAWWSVTWTTSPTPTQAGWLNRYVTSPARMVWYETWTGGGNAPAWITIGTSGPNLAFQAVSASTVILNNVATVTDALTQG